MLKVTSAAAQQIKSSAAQSDAEGAVLRVAARKMVDGGIDYTMGFDDRKEDDAIVEMDGVTVVVSLGQQELVQNTTLDYVELDDGEPNFVFIDDANPRHQEQS